MAVIKWNESLSVKIASIDAQHQKLVELLNTFYDNISKGTHKDKMLSLIGELKEYTVNHFSTEEKYMKQTAYPDSVAHMAEHKKFIASVLNFEERYKSGKMLLSIEVTNFLKDWISNHITGTDKKYTEWFTKHGVR